MQGSASLSRTKSHLLGTVALLLSLGCESGPGTGTPGELGDGTFEYVCVNRGDAKCSSAESIDDFERVYDFRSKTALPRAVAVGATFGVRYAGTVRSEGQVMLVTVSAASRNDEVTPGVFSLSQPVEAAFIATANDGTAVDFVVVTALEAEELSIWQSQREVTSLNLQVGQRALLTVAPRSATGTLLAGALRYQWVTTRPQAVALGRVTSDTLEDEIMNQGDISILGVSEGNAVVRVRSGNLEAAVRVEVTQ
jgi:hypothetical protein